MAQDNAHSPPKSGPESGNEFDRRKAAWEQPEFQRIGADEAETGINFGPEILILIS